MKIITFFFITLAAPLCCRGETTVSGMQDGHALSVTGSQAPQIEKSSTALLASCDFEAPSRIATDDRWKQALGASHVHLVFSEPRKFSFRFSASGPASFQEVSAEEILIPMSHQSSPDYVLVRFHDHVRAFAMYHDKDALGDLQKMLLAPSEH